MSFVCILWSFFFFFAPGDNFYSPSAVDLALNINCLSVLFLYDSGKETSNHPEQIKLKRELNEKGDDDKTQKNKQIKLKGKEKESFNSAEKER